MEPEVHIFFTLCADAIEDEHFRDEDFEKEAYAGVFLAANRSRTGSNYN